MNDVRHGEVTYRPRIGVECGGDACQIVDSRVLLVSDDADYGRVLRTVAKASRRAGRPRRTSSPRRVLRAFRWACMPHHGVTALLAPIRQSPPGPAAFSRRSLAT
jgi:hypothetical protein